jgi:hypothetical protein
MPEPRRAAGCACRSAGAVHANRRRCQPPPPAPREFRAAWVSTVANIDWPSRSNLTTAKQQAEALAILDRAKALNLNAIVLQVRPSADAIYPSTLEPWSEFLTGQQGRAPAQPWDPLQFWIEQAHARGLELHAWFNPYRARHATAKSPLAANHIGRTQPEVVKSYGRYLWMDPGEAAASQHTLDVVLDVVRRYDIDGVHIDDYFYPYPIDTPNAAGPEGVALDGGVGAKQELEFPDQPSWQRYLLGGGTLDRANWRRQNVNSLIEAMYTGIRKERAGCDSASAHSASAARTSARPASSVSASTTSCMRTRNCGWPTAGSIIWRRSCTGRVASAAGVRCAARLLAGAEHARATSGRPVHQPHRQQRQGFRAGRNRQADRRHAQPQQRARPPALSIAALMENRKGIADQLKAQAYQSAALTPATPWLGAEAPAAPQAAARREATAWRIEAVRRRGQAGGAVCDLVALRQRVALRGGPGFASGAAAGRRCGGRRGASGGGQRGRPPR